jgi:putative nucleotidyltransferase with HDIG domain
MQSRHEEIRRAIMDTTTLPTLPGIIAKLQSLSESDKASAAQMAQIVASDQVLSARVLRLVNSPSYGFYRVASISNAIILLGVNVVKSLALSSSIFEIMEEHLLGLWEHSLGSGVAASVIARRLSLANAEEIATAALLHDIGKVIIKINFATDYHQLRARVDEHGMSIREAELELLGMDHAEVGAWLARSWHLPDKLVEPVACHHDVARSLEQRDKTAAVHLADILVKASPFGGSGDDLVPPIQEIAWERLGMNDGILVEVVEELEEKLVEVRNFSMEIQADQR